MNKQISLLVLFCLLFTANLFAQDDSRRQERFEKFKAEREAYITKELQLTEDEAKAFWPLCDELQMKKFEASKEVRELMRKERQARRDGKKLSEAEYKKIVQLNADTKLKEAQLDKEYMNKFLEVIPAEKAYRYQRAEQDFARKSSEKRNKEREEQRQQRGTKR
jgi:hypothetical protein